MSTQIARHWRLNSQRYQLVGEVCPNCSGKIFPPRDVCPHCADKERQPDYQFSGKGEVYSHSTVYKVPEGYEEAAPYTVALVKLDEGPLVTAQLTDVANEAVNIGMPVEMVTRKLKTQGDEGLIVYGYKFRPQMAAS
ncbi:Zn-ribbon domain-containing OB-fold protein [Anaerolineales bacterium HSG6]|nr:Zn-ribbon domain-containing OB-fold protein [Anaerolineales bacterium HSG6]